MWNAARTSSSLLSADAGARRARIARRWTTPPPPEQASQAPRRRRRSRGVTALWTVSSRLSDDGPQHRGPAGGQLNAPCRPRLVEVDARTDRPLGDTTTGTSLGAACARLDGGAAIT